jgi:tetratricopeptide (TPR) repeat protein
MTPATANDQTLSASAIKPLHEEPTFSGLSYPDQNNESPDSEPQLQMAARQFLAGRKSIAKARLRLNRNNPATLCLIGDTHMNAGRFARAKNAYLSALREDEAFLPAYLKVIDSMLMLRDLNGALKQAYRGLYHSDDNEEIWARRLLISSLQLSETHNSDELKTLLNDFRKFLKNYQEHTSTIKQYGIMLAVEAHDHKAAKEQFERVLEINSKDPDAYNNLGLTYAELKDQDKALSLIHKAVDIKPDYLIGYQNILAISVVGAKYDKALDAISLARTNDITLPQQWSLLEGWLLIENGDFKKAVAWHEEALEKYPNNDMLLNNLGFAQEKLGKLDDALDSYDESVKQAVAQKIFNRGPLVQFYNRMILAKAMGEKEKMRDTARLLMKIDPNNQAAYYFLGDGSFGRHTVDIARTTIKRILDLHPDDLASVSNLTFILTTIDKKYDEAIELALNTKDYETSPTIVNNLAYSYLKKGDLDEAQRLLTKHATMFKENNYLLATKGLLNLYRDNMTEAKKLYEKAIQLSGQNKEYAQQVWEYEQASYYLNKLDMKKAKSHLKAAVDMGDESYAYEDSLRLLEEKFN